MNDIRADQIHLPVRHARRPHRRRAARRLYPATFSVLFILALPICALAWAYDLLSRRKVPPAGPMRSARRHAGFIAPVVLA
jgi:hypothetical protein